MITWQNEKPEQDESWQKSDTVSIRSENGTRFIVRDTEDGGLTLEKAHDPAGNNCTVMDFVIPGAVSSDQYLSVAGPVEIK